MRARETRVRKVKDTGAEIRVTDTELRVKIRVLQIRVLLQIRVPPTRSFGCIIQVLIQVPLI